MNVKEIKKAFAIVICCTMISTSTVFAFSGKLNVNSRIKIKIDNEWIQAELNPFIENDRTLVHLNKFIEKLGANFESDLTTGAIKIFTDEVTIELKIGKNSAKILTNEGGSLKEVTVNLEISPRVVEENVYIPLRFTAETLGFDVKWDNYLRSVIIRTLGDIIIFERPIEFEMIERKSINDNELLLNLFDKNYMNKGVYSLMDGDYVYVLVTAGERPSGRYSLVVNSITEVTPGFAYIHATLNSPQEGSIVTQALTYPNIMVKFNKNSIQDIQWDLSGDISGDEAEKNDVINFVQSFGAQLKMVSLLAPEDILKEAMNKYYGDYVSTELIGKWIKDPVAAPGRLTSSPWPERIDVLSLEKIAENEYVVKGNIVELTSVEMEEGGIATKREITLNVRKTDNKWMIVDAELGCYEVNEKY